MAEWRSGNGVGRLRGRINEVTLRRARLVLGWVTCLGLTLGGGTPRGAGVPPFRLCTSLVHSLPHLLLFITCPFFLFSFTLLIFFYCPSDPFLPE